MVYCVGFSLFVLLFCLKFFEQLYVSLSFVSCVSVLHAYDIILYWTFISGKSFFTHFFKEIRLWKQSGGLICIILRTVWKAKRCQSGMNVKSPWHGSHGVAYTWENMIRGSWLDVSFSPHVKNAIRDIWLAFRYLYQFVNENLFRAFFVSKSQYVYKFVYFTSSITLGIKRKQRLQTFAWYA